MSCLEELQANETIIVWENLTVSVPARRRSLLGNLRRRFSRRPFEESAVILKGVSGYARTRNLVAIMGPSGAGKTTFLAALAGKIATTQGSVRINGQQVLSQGILSEISGYLPQFDALPPSLTVLEHLFFMCALKTNGTASQRSCSSTRLTNDLGLVDCRDTLISKLSGGQRKRLSLACELITRPMMLFLDEPTTGLDMFSAMQVVETLRMISLNETIVFCTIHQPGMDVYNLFSHVIFMSDGRIPYFGTLENATRFFSGLGFECPVGFNESEYFIKLLSIREPEMYSLIPDESNTVSMECIDRICGEFLRSPLSKIPEIPSEKQLNVRSQRKAGCIVQFVWLTWRIWVQNRRTIFADWCSWLSYFLSMAAVAIFYAGINPHTQMGVQNARGVLYLMSSEISFTVAYSVIYEFPGQLLIYLRENSVYSCGPYYVATFLGLIPKAILKALLFTAVIYFILIADVDLLNFLLYCLTTSTAAICGTMYGLMFSSWIDDVDITTSIMVPIDMLYLLTAGMFYNLRYFILMSQNARNDRFISRGKCSLPVYLTCCKYLSIFFYLNEALSIIYWSRIDDIECETSGNLPCLRSGDDVLSEYGFIKSNYQWDLYGLATLTITMGLVGYFGVRRRRITAML